MTGPADIPRGHHDMVWVFAVDLPPAELAKFTIEDGIDDDGRTPSALRAALNGMPVDPDFIEFYDVAAMSSVGLRPYLAAANGLSQDQVDADARLLDGLTGHLVLIFSRALPDGPRQFDCKPPLRLIGRYGSDISVPSMAALPAQSAAGILTPRTKAPMSDARIGGMVAMAALIVMFLLVAFIIWSAG